MTDKLVHKSVADVMTPYLITCAPYTTLAEANELMVKNQIRRLPVVEAAIVRQWREDNLIFSGAH